MISVGCFFVYKGYKEKYKGTESGGSFLTRDNKVRYNRFNVKK